MICIFIYIVCIPFFETPSWCLDKNENKWEFIIDCKALDNTIPFSNTTCINTTYLCIVDALCIIMFAYSRYYRRKFDAEYEPHEIREDIIFMIATTVSFITILVSIYNNNQPFLTDLIRPIIVA